MRRSRSCLRSFGQRTHLDALCLGNAQRETSEAYLYQQRLSADRATGYQTHSLTGDKPQFLESSGNGVVCMKFLHGLHQGGAVLGQIGQRHRSPSGR